MRTLRVLLRKEFLQIRRDKVILRMLFVMPVIQLMVLANAATFEVKRSRIWVVDQDRSEVSAALVQRLVGSGRFAVAGRSPTQMQADEALMSRGADVILAIPSGFARDIGRVRRANVQLAFNAEDGAQAGVASSYATTVIADYGAELGADLRPTVVSADPGRQLPVPGQPRLEVQRRFWYNPTLDYHRYMVPGILVQLVTIVGTIMTALNIVREKEAGTLDQLNVTPIGRATFVTAKLLPLWIIGLLQLTFGIIVGRVVFGVPLEGPILLVYLAAAIYLIAALGLGLWVSVIVDTQQQALFVAFALMMVYILMSGLFTPIRSMPDWAQFLANFNPLMHFIALMRAVMLKGAGLMDVLPRLGALVLSGLVIMTLAVRQYHKGAA
jgi:ABC-2 type transport system permease protein